jgi:hypothetical protein
VFPSLGLGALFLLVAASLHLGGSSSAYGAPAVPSSLALVLLFLSLGAPPVHSFYLFLLGLGGAPGPPWCSSHNAICCDFSRREDELMTELMNQKRSTS